MLLCHLIIVLRFSEWQRKIYEHIINYYESQVYPFIEFCACTGQNVTYVITILYCKNTLEPSTHWCLIYNNYAVNVVYFKCVRNFVKNENV